MEGRINGQTPLGNGLYCHHLVLNRLVWTDDAVKSLFITPDQCLPFFCLFPFPNPHSPIHLHLIPHISFWKPIHQPNISTWQHLHPVILPHPTSLQPSHRSINLPAIPSRALQRPSHHIPATPPSNHQPTLLSTQHSSRITSPLGHTGVKL